MNKLLLVLGVFALVLLSCTGNQKTSTDTAPADSADSAMTEPADSLEELVEEVPMPKAADELFDDFIFNFAANKKLQLSRIKFPLQVEHNGATVAPIAKANWQVDHFFMNQEYYTLLFNSHKQMEFMKDTSVSHVVIEKIYLEQSHVKQYIFDRVRGLWMLNRIKEMPIQENANASFLQFYHKFATDSEFQLKSLNSTVMFVGPDPDDDFSQMEGVITPDTWPAFAPELPSGMLYNIIYGKEEQEGHQKIFMIRGIANGFEVELNFKRVGDRWLLTKLIT